MNQFCIPQHVFHHDSPLNPLFGLNRFPAWIVAIAQEQWTVDEQGLALQALKNPIQETSHIVTILKNDSIRELAWYLAYTNKDHKWIDISLRDM